MLDKPKPIHYLYPYSNTTAQKLIYPQLYHYNTIDYKHYYL